MQDIEECEGLEDAVPGSEVPSPDAPLKLSKDEWKKRLPGESYRSCARRPERAGQPSYDEKRRASSLACCGLPLFPSAMSTSRHGVRASHHIPGVFDEEGLSWFSRSGIRLQRCGGHHGHVFDDGPPPTKQRWCNNGVALRFIPKEGKV